MKKVLILDNYDSFTYNLVQIVENILDKRIDVRRNDEIELSAVDIYEYIILSPGPGLPDEAGILKALIKQYGQTKKILGVCLGLQAIGEVYGCTLRNLDKVFHGMQTEMHTTASSSPIFNNIQSKFLAGRYHSWVIDRNSLKDQLVVTCTDENNEIMAVDHNTHQVYGVQFHPESILTPDGNVMIKNFLSID